MNNEALLTELLEDYNSRKFYQSMHTIEACAQDRSSWIRSLVARLGALYVNPLMRRILIDLSHDRDYLTRAEVADSLSEYVDEEVFDRLIQLCRDSHYLVRAYAYSSIGSLAKAGIRTNDAVGLLKDAIKVSRRRFVKINCYEALYILGDNESIKGLGKLFASANYRDQCAIIHCFEEILNKTNKELVYQYLTSFQKKAKAAVVLKSIKKALENWTSPEK